jgi:Lar family restriction alleviation protein
MKRPKKKRNVARSTRTRDRIDAEFEPSLKPSKPSKPSTVLPCPFCGWQPTVEPRAELGILVSCEMGDAVCPANPSTVGSTRARAIAAWNTRA